MIINLVLKELQTIFVNRTFPMPPGLFSKLRRIIVLAGKEATYVQREQAKRIYKHMRLQRPIAC